MKLHTLHMIIHMLLGGKCKYPNQTYLVIHKDGSFVVEGTGTQVGAISKLQKYHAS